MPVRHGSQSKLSRPGEGSSDAQNRNMYLSSPDLSPRNHHRRSSSNDSLDGSYHHSRQSSGSSENYPTRTSTRRTSSTTAPATVDPLQFVKFHRQTDLARQAEEQMKLAATQKEEKEVTVAVEEKTAEDWQSNLSKWKSRRKSQSSAAYQLKDELEAAGKDDEEMVTALGTKTFTQMQQERERRKSLPNRNFYPLDEDEQGGNDGESAGHSRRNLSAYGRDEDGDERGGRRVSTEPVEDPFDEPEKSPRNRPMPAKRRVSNTKTQENGSFHQNYSEVSDTKPRTPSLSDKMSNLRSRFQDEDDNEDEGKSHRKTYERFEQSSGGNRTVHERRTEYTERDTEPHSEREQEVSRTDDLSMLSERSSQSSRLLDQDLSMLSERSSDSTKSPRSARDFTEKSIKISHRPNSEKGFGFTVGGGKDVGEPVTVTKVSLGSAADVCELMSRDEILAINRQDVSQHTNDQVKQLIQDAVKSGQLELRVRRNLANDDMEDEEFLSSDEEVESFGQSPRYSHTHQSEQGRQDHDHTEVNQQADFRAAVNNNPVASALASKPSEVSLDERQWTGQQREQESDKQTEEPQMKPARSQIYEHSTRTEYSSRTERVPRMSKSPEAEDSPSDEPPPRPARTFRQESPADSNNTGGGPPAILRKWQKQRPKPDYGVTSPPEQRLSASIPWLDNNIPEHEQTSESITPPRKDTSPRQQDHPIPSPRIYSSEPKQEDFNWNHQSRTTEYGQDEQLSPPHTSSPDTHVSNEPFYQQSSHQSSRLDDPYYSPTNKDNAQPTFQQSPSRQHEQYHSIPNEERNQSSSMSFQVRGQGDQVDVGRPSMLVIDPRNRGDDSGYSLQVQLHDDGSAVLNQPPSHQRSQNTFTPVVDIDAIRQEERRKILEEENERRRQEEDRRFREKEAQLRKQEEELREKEERLRREKEQFLREQEQLHKRSESLDKQSDVKLYNAPVSKFREPSPSSRATVTRRYPEVVHSNQQPQFSSTIVVEPKTQYSVTARESLGEINERGRLSREDMLAMNRKATPLQMTPDVPSSPSSSNSINNNPIKRQSLSRQQVHSLNAVPKPKFRASQDWIGGESSLPSNFRTGGRHSEIMKKQYSTPQEHWLFEEAERRRKLSGYETQSPQTRNYANSQFSGPIKPTADNHWREDSAVERQSTTSLNSSFDSFSNNSNDNNNNMPAAIRQTLLKKTASARSSPGMGYSQDPTTMYGQFNQGPALSQTMLASALSQSMPANNKQPIKSFMSADNVSPSWAAPPSGDKKPPTFTTLSGRQLCSHCNQELGYGAAMIIESLGLSYHVQCFRCCVCHTPLGSGTEGADVRVRVNKLHCPNCYSNDEAGLKFSKV